MSDVHIVLIYVLSLFMFFGLVITVTVFLLNIWEEHEENRRRLNRSQYPKHKK